MMGTLVLRPKAQPGHTQVSKSSTFALKKKQPTAYRFQAPRNNLDMTHLSETEDLSLPQHPDQPFPRVNVKFRLSRLNVLV